MITVTKPIVYLSGPIAHCTLEQIHRWRDDFTRAWGKDFVRDPTERRYSADQNWSHHREIITKDKAEIMEADITLANISDPPVGHQMWGTPMEIIWAFEQGKQVYIICNDPNKISPWVIGHSHQHFTSVKNSLIFMNGKFPVRNIA